jgi:hypothetical protein
MRKKDIRNQESRIRNQERDLGVRSEEPAFAKTRKGWKPSSSIGDGTTAETTSKRNGGAAIQTKSPPFSESAKDEVVSSPFGQQGNEGNPQERSRLRSE